MTVTLKEIVYYLTMAEGLSNRARNILVKIFTKFDIEKSIVDQILFLERRYNEAYVNSKIQMIQRPKKVSFENKEQKVALCITKSMCFLLDYIDILKLRCLDKSLNAKLTPVCYEEILSRENLDQQSRTNVYRMIIPKRYKVGLVDEKDRRLFIFQRRSPDCSFMCSGDQTRPGQDLQNSASPVQGRVA